MNKTLVNLMSYIALPMAIATTSLSSCVVPDKGGEIIKSDYTNALSSGMLSQMPLYDTNKDSVPDALGPLTWGGFYAVDTTVHGTSRKDSDVIGKSTLLLGPEDFQVFAKTNEYVNKSLHILKN